MSNKQNSVKDSNSENNRQIIAQPVDSATVVNTDPPVSRPTLQPSSSLARTTDIPNSPLQEGLKIPSPLRIPKPLTAGAVTYNKSYNLAREAFKAPKSVPDPKIHVQIFPRIDMLSETDYVSLVARILDAAGSTVIAEDVCNILKDIHGGSVNHVFDGLNDTQKTHCQELFNKANKLLELMQKVRTNMDGIRVECGNLTSHSAGELAKPFMLETAIWVLDQLRITGEILLPVDYESVAKVGHNTLLYINRKSDSDEFDMHYIETFFQAKDGIKKDAVRKQQIVNIAGQYIYDRGKLFQPSDFNSEDRAMHRDLKARIFAVKSLTYKFESVSNPDNMDKDAHTIVFFLGSQFIKPSPNITEANSAIQMHLSSLGDWQNRQQRVVRVQNPFACELSSILAFCAFLFNDEVAF